MQTAAVSAGVFYELKDAANGALQLTVIADSEWMSGEPRIPRDDRSADRRKRKRLYDDV